MSHLVDPKRGSTLTPTGEKVGRMEISLDMWERRLIHHPIEDCQSDGHPCCIHSPSDHHMRDWVMNYRDDRGIMERICEDNGIGHPDPDDVAFHKRRGNDISVHGCDGCCGSDLNPSYNDD